MFCRQFKTQLNNTRTPTTPLRRCRCVLACAARAPPARRGPPLCLYDASWTAGLWGGCVDSFSSHGRPVVRSARPASLQLGRAQQRQCAHLRPVCISCVRREICRPDIYPLINLIIGNNCIIKIITDPSGSWGGAVARYLIFGNILYRV